MAKFSTFKFSILHVTDKKTKIHLSKMHSIRYVMCYVVLTSYVWCVSPCTCEFMKACSCMYSLGYPFLQSSIPHDKEEL